MTARWQTQLKQRFTSEVLWHFVGRNKSNEQAYEILLSILRSGLKVTSKKVDFKYVDSKSGQLKTLWGYPVSCLADIPLKDLHIHAERYGLTAIGFHKESAARNHFNPVLYVNQYSGFFSHFMKIRDELEANLTQTNKELAEKFDELLLLLGSIAKTGDILGNPINDPNWDDMQLNNFYYEREWRSITNWDFKEADVAAIILPDTFVDRFYRDRRRELLRISESTLILPFSMIYRF